jgi:glycerophosphoryl diester phosphodiesterase
MTRRFIIMVAFCLGIGSCIPEFPSAPDLSSDFEMIDMPTTPLGPGGRSAMGGVYDVQEGKDLLGDSVVCKWVGKRWCVYSNTDVIFAETAGGALGDSVKLWGYVRTVRSGEGTKMTFTILPGNGGRAIVSGGIPQEVKIDGLTQGGQRIQLRRQRSLNSNPIEFHVLAHQGGGRNSDRLGYSENSIPMMEHAEVFGADGIEIDVRSTRDRQIIVFHDETFSPRTVQGIYLLGPVEDFDLQQIRLFGILKNGESIPTLREALNAVIENTTLSYVWLDTKQADVVDSVIQIQKAAKLHAAALNRHITILLGLPYGADDVRNAYLRNPDRNSVEVLVEGDEPERAYETPNCKVWAPFWALYLPEKIKEARAHGIKVFVWTVDIPEKIREYMDQVDGILSNYPSLVTGIHDSK